MDVVYACFARYLIRTEARNYNSERDVALFVFCIWLPNNRCCTACLKLLSDCSWNQTSIISCSGVVLILPLMHHHLHAQCNKMCPHPWLKVIEYKMKKTSSSTSVPSRVIAGLSGDIMRKMCHKKLAPLTTRSWDSELGREFFLGQDFPSNERWQVDNVFLGQTPKDEGK